ncbi:MAG TPA: hypothetical protein VFE62_06405 [Gemmataceae bacterium]|nr:hypothetical protein [Gemmataceae bacterium]
MFHIIATDFPTLSTNVLRALYDATEALRLAVSHLDRAERDFDDELDDESNIARDNLDDARAIATVNAAILQELTSGPPTIPDRVFRTIAGWERRCPWNQEYAEGAILALRLAAICLERARDLLFREGGEQDDAWLVVCSAARSVATEAELLRSSSAPFTCPFDADEALERMINGDNLPTVSEHCDDALTHYRAHLAKNPNGDEYHTREDLEKRISMLEAHIAADVVAAKV